MNLFFYLNLSNDAYKLPVIMYETKYFTSKNSNQNLMDCMQRRLHVCV